MFVWSEAQARRLLGASPRQSGGSRNSGDSQDKPQSSEGHSFHEDEVEAAEGTTERDLWVGDRLLDLGAGDGFVTQVLEDGAGQVFATETSSVMRKRLRDRGYR